MPGHPESLRRDALRNRPTAPAVTWYDAADGARVELSHATLDNWTAKVGHFLREECGLEPGDTIVIDMPLHWLVPVWCAGAWSAGIAVCAPDAVDPDSSARGTVVASVDRSETWLRRGFEVLACPQTPWAMPLDADTPAGATDAMADVRAMPDSASWPMPDAVNACVVLVGGRTWTGTQATAAVGRTLAAGARAVLIADEPATGQLLAAVAIGGLVAGVPTVLVTHANPTALDEVARRERAQAPRPTA